MNANDLFDAIGRIDEKIIDFAEDYDFKKVKRLSSCKIQLAAAIVILICALPIVNIMSDLSGKSTESADNEHFEQVQETQSIATEETCFEKIILYEFCGKGSARLSYDIPWAENIESYGFDTSDLTINSEEAWTVYLLIYTNSDEIGDFSFDFTDTISNKSLTVEFNQTYLNQVEAEIFKHQYQS